MRYSEVIEECEYCHHSSLVALCFKKHEEKFSLSSHRQWTEVVSLTARSDPNFYDRKCYDYIPFIILSLLLLKNFMTQILFCKYFCFLYLLFLKSFISFLRSISITCYFPQLLRKKICQGTTECILNKLRNVYANVSMPRVVCCWSFCVGFFFF